MIPLSASQALSGAWRIAWTVAADDDMMATQEQAQCQVVSIDIIQKTIIKTFELLLTSCHAIMGMPARNKLKEMRDNPRA